VVHRFFSVKAMYVIIEKAVPITQRHTPVVDRAMNSG
jgi:hypothetical protein